MKGLIKLTLLASNIFSVQAKEDVELVFHMGLGANGHYQIGGVIENHSQDTLLNSAITYITIDDLCHPGKAQIANLGKIDPHDELEFRIPVEGKLSSYRILNISAWDSIGIPKAVNDKTAETIKNREAEYIKKCNSKE